MQFSEIQGKLNKMEDGQKITTEEHGAKKTEDRINIQLSKLQMDINEDIKEVKAEVNAGKNVFIDVITWPVLWLPLRKDNRGTLLEVKKTNGANSALEKEQLSGPRLRCPNKYTN